MFHLNTTTLRSTGTDNSTTVCCQAASIQLVDFVLGPARQEGGSHATRAPRHGTALGRECVNHSLRSNRRSQPDAKKQRCAAAGTWPCGGQCGHVACMKHHLTTPCVRETLPAILPACRCVCVLVGHRARRVLPARLPVRYVGFEPHPGSGNHYGHLKP